ncbi:hypothetical protein BX600DRAFT_210755 [Xylariales sp. PMI_506]|nr:hypothetical protein BX600DRAFT_210755 [Xylariales sp. PMI_506]
MATTAEANSGDNSGAPPLDDGAISPTNKTAIAPAIQPSSALESLSMRADPDAQATVTDYLDFTEYLPADVNRSLTLIGKLDQTYIDASVNVDNLTKTWSQLPLISADQRPSPVQLRADISDHLNRAVSSRVSSYAEARRMSESVTRHVNRAKTILTKLQTMMENYPTEEQRSPVQTRSPQMSRAPKLTLRLDKDGQKIRRPPRITVPGEVLAPYELEMNMYTSSSEESSEDEVSVSPPRRSTPASRIKLPKTSKVPKQKTPKVPRAGRQSLGGSGSVPMLSTSTALAKLQPPPENAVIGSADAPWLQLTPYELAKLRKRMKKNAVWNPSDTMIARELKALGRGVEAYKAAKKKAEDEGQPFEPALPAPVIDAESGAQHPPAGAISAEALGAEEVQLSNRGMKLNEAKKLKREALAKQAVEEAEESARKMAEAARMFFNHEASPSATGSVAEGGAASQPASQNVAATKTKTKKRKRDSVSEPAPPEIKTEVIEATTPMPIASAKPQVKRTKTETPVPPPQLTPRPTSVPPPHTTPIPPRQLNQTTPVMVASTTPVPVPAQPLTDTPGATTKSIRSPSSGTSPVPGSANTVTTTTIPTKPPAETPVPPPKTSTTPIPPPTRDLGRRETRKESQKSLQPTTTNAKQSSTSRPTTPIPITSSEQQSAASRRPGSRGKASSAEPPTTLASDRPRRASTARNTPAPEVRLLSKRLKRPAPGVVSTGSGGTSAIGKRKAAPRKRPRGTKKGVQNQQVEPDAEVEVDDDGNVIDPDEPRYCICNGVSFGTMIQCDNVDNCKQEWFHIECVGLSAIPARTTKWYCPDCRVLLNIGERGEVTSRGVKM